MLKVKNRNAPISIQDHPKWQSGRRSFLKAILLGAVVTQIPWWMSCTSDDKSNSNFVFNQKEKEILMIVQDFLFPSDAHGPSAADVKAANYLQWVVLDPEMDIEEIQYIFNGIKWVGETAQEEKEKEFLQLNKKEQEEILVFIAGQNWGESWYSVLLTFIFEALLSDPVYGSNLEGSAWKWLNHNPGNPRPAENQKYGKFLTHVNSIKHN